MLHGDVRDVGAPDLIGPRNGHASEQIRIDPVRRVRIGGSRRLIDHCPISWDHLIISAVKFVFAKGKLFQFLDVSNRIE